MNARYKLCFVGLLLILSVTNVFGKVASRPKALAMATISGEPLRINVGSDTAFQVYNSALPNAAGQIYPNDAMLGNAGFFVREDNRTVGFDSFSSQQIGSVSGNGSSTNPFVVSSTGNPGFADLVYQETVSYVNGQSFFTKRLTLTNQRSTARSLKVFLYGDIFLANSDEGVPFLQPQAGAPGGQTCPGQAPYTILFISRSPASSGYQAGEYAAVANAVRDGVLNNSVESGCIDNGAAVQWDITLPASGASLSVEAVVSFGEIPSGVIAPTLVMSTNPRSAAPGSTSTVSWSSSVAGAVCAPSGGAGTSWASLGTLPAAGSRAITVPNALGTVSFSLTCTGAGSSSNATTTLSVVAPPPPPVLVSQTSGVGGQAPNSFSGRPVLSDRASFVAFESAASNLVAGDSNNAQDIFLRERSNNTLKLVSVDANGAPLVGLSSGEPSISRDGVRLAFVSGTGISQTDSVSAKRRVTNGQVRVYDSRTSKTSVISNAPSGAPGNGASNNPQVVDNVVVFQSESTNLGAQADANGVSDVFVHELGTGLTSLLSAPNVLPQSGAKLAGCGSSRPRISANNVVAFESCQVLATGATSTAVSHIYATTVAGKRAVLVSRGGSGTPGSADSNNAAMSSDGNFVFFDSAADNLVAGDTNGRRDVFRARLTLSGTTLTVGPVERVSLSFSGAQGDGASERPATCGEGRYVTFESDASNLFPQTGSGVRNVLAKDLSTGLVAKMSQTSGSANASGASSEPALSPDCSAVVFATEANNLSSSATSNNPDVVLASNPLNLNYTGHWHNPAESGWGLTIAHQGDVLFPNWFTFDIDGRPLWLSMVAGARLASDGSYTGAIYRSRGVPFSAPGGGTASVPLPIVGQGKLSFTASNSLRFDYTIGSVSQSKILEPLYFRDPTICEFAPSAVLSTARNFTDVWDNNASEAGWGVHMTHQRDTIFGLWYTYDANGRDQWLTGTARDPNGSNVFTGELRRLTGLPFANINGAQAFITAPVVGTISFSITSGTTGSMTYTLDGVTQTKPLRRYAFSSPASLCRSGSG